jgi:hypothetical protein
VGIYIDEMVYLVGGYVVEFLFLSDSDSSERFAAAGDVAARKARDISKKNHPRAHR